MDNFKIEKLSEKYVDDVFDLEQRLLGKVDKRSILNTIDSDSLNYFLLLNDDKLIGFFECSIIVPEIELFDIVIDKDFQGNGYSKLLMDYLVKFGKNNKCDTIFLEVNIMNYKAINLYEKYGFEKYSIRKKYYGDNDAVLMKLVLK